MVLNTKHILRPVILPVPAKVGRWHPRKRVEFLSLHAREALTVSAQKSGIELGELTKDADGVPLPSNRHYWSITHKARYVAAVVSPGPVGIDLEEVRSVHAGLYQRVAGEDEWHLASTGSGKREIFFRFWTAKEAVMKAAGTGIKDLSRIKIRQVQGRQKIFLTFADNSWEVQQYYFDDHIAAITSNDSDVEWSMG